MAFIDDLAICPYYIKIKKKRITCESFEKDVKNSLIFKTEGKALGHFGKYCRSFCYNSCPYAYKLTEKYEDD